MCGPTAALRIYGNAWADARARVAATWHPTEPEVDVSLARAAAMAGKLLPYYAVLLDWATAAEGRLPEPTPIEQVFKLPRPPVMPEHCLVHDAAGQERCIRCLLPAALSRGRPCRPHGVQGHRLCRLGSGVFCCKCGCYSFMELNKLRVSCPGRVTAKGNEWRLKRMIAGRDPRSDEFIGTPSFIDPATEAFDVILS